MKKNCTELVFILDKSGSMNGLEKDTIGGFNSLIEKQRKEEGECMVTTVFFNHEVTKVHDRIDLREVPKLTEKEYFTEGSTALIDAIGETVEHIENIHKYAREEDVPEHTIFVITTDGMENASRKFRADDIREKIKGLQEKKKWEFVFFGANIDAVKTAEDVGIDGSCARNYKADKRGVCDMYNMVCETVSVIRKKK